MWPNPYPGLYETRVYDGNDRQRNDIKCPLCEGAILHAYGDKDILAGGDTVAGGRQQARTTIRETYAVHGHVNV